VVFICSILASKSCEASIPRNTQFGSKYVRAQQLHSCRQFISRLRSKEEISNRFLRLTRSLTHSAFPHQTLYDLEWLVDILCARANAHLVCPSGHLSSLSIFPGFHAQQERARFFYDIYCPSPSLSTLSFAPPHTAAPAVFHLGMWKMLIEHLPTNDMQYGVLLHAHAERQLRAITKPELAAAVLPYSQASWAHGFPHNRADALYRSHYVLLVEYCLTCDPDSESTFAVQATVHPSMRNYRLHYPLLHIPLNSPRGAFSMTKHTCSCEGGYIHAACTSL